MKFINLYQKEAAKEIMSLIDLYFSVEDGYNTSTNHHDDGSMDFAISQNDRVIGMVMLSSDISVVRFGSRRDILRGNSRTIDYPSELKNELRLLYNANKPN